MKLGVNIDHVATLRNARGGLEPNVLEAAFVVEKTGANAVTVHLREDRRHIKDEDVKALKENLTTLKINLEMAATEEMLEIAKNILPYSCCLVPEKRQELTTEGGLDVKGQEERLKKYIEELHSKNIVVSLFIDPNESQVRASSNVGADYIELHTGSYANAKGQDKEKELEKLMASASLAQSLGLKVNAGHGLDYENVSEMKKISGLCELNIGHSIISKAVFTGLESAIKEMMNLIS